MVSNRRVLFLYKLEINRIERIYRFKGGTACYSSSLKVLGKPDTQMNKQQTHAETSVGIVCTILVYLENFLGSQRQE